MLLHPLLPAPGVSAAGAALGFKTFQQKRHMSHPTLNESFVSGVSGDYVDGLYEGWKRDPSSVHKSWQVFFQNLDSGASPNQANTLPPVLNGGLEPAVSQISAKDRAATDYMKLVLLVRSYQVRGHYLAHLDPLEINSANIHMKGEGDVHVPAFLNHRTYGFTDEDLNKTFELGGAAVGAASAGILATGQALTLGQILDTLKTAYCRTIGVEFTHISDQVQQNWIRNKFEVREGYNLSKEEVLNMFDRLVFATNFESFLATKYGVTKRFGLEGIEAFIPGMKSCIDTAVEGGCSHITIGMPHRGRLNVLANVMRKPLEEILYEFIEGPLQGDKASDAVLGSGDVKYHLGYSIDRPTTSGKPVHLSLVPNPSHLEASNPIVLGKTRAKQHFMGDTSRRKAMSLLLHGDAAFAGQGVVYETLELSNIKGYTTGGTIHMVVNNQIGFTTDPRFARSSPYCTDVAKTVGAPIFHVNADDLMAVIFVCKTAAEFRMKFGKDVVIDIVGYRRYGHNEVDEPAFTQPLMYQKIAAQESALKKFQKEALETGLLTQEEIDNVMNTSAEIFETAFAKARSGDVYVPDSEQRRKSGSSWAGFKHMREFSEIRSTGISPELFAALGEKLYSYPDGFNLHKGLVRVMKAKAKMFETGQGFDWATAEALAWASLMKEGVHIRLSGQDVERGTFSHRHCVLHDQEDESKYVPLQNLGEEAAPFSVHNSNLSEYGVLGFELGYSMESPQCLVMWEAQFGDFANTAQVIIDQFLCSSEQKWLRQSALVMLLPHGYEGQGPEHSSCRVERFLQLSDDDPEIIPNMDEHSRLQLQQCNWQIVNCTTPANYFHVLRRQIMRDFRKPLIMISPKSLLRHPGCVSKAEDFHTGMRFRRLISEREPDAIFPPEQIKRVIFCTGKVYFDLVKYRKDNDKKGVAIVTMEQICPFPFDRVQTMAQRYPNAEVVWVQEEPQNMGCWSYVEQRFATALKSINGQRAAYIGRNPAASPATGNGTIHQAELDQFLHASFDLAPAPDRMAPIRWRY